VPGPNVRPKVRLASTEACRSFLRGLLYLWGRLIQTSRRDVIDKKWIRGRPDGQPLSQSKLGGSLLGQSMASHWSADCQPS
jgi:hypothetical protein